ncbi:hypothetical protein FA15DRAFT_662361 [Coprinopsis marcescibilis]|uniref:Cora-domain-containing protein n=1 Tax=Coprinopsis marcescibilis TaxID=230819 RepID=A0A5C3LEQ6_COPMA|nr:hypothetical protein FA15DRAFT_662361 [Coprinopsis marcescibilis]
MSVKFDPEPHELSTIQPERAHDTASLDPDDIYRGDPHIPNDTASSTSASTSSSSSSTSTSSSSNWHGGRLGTLAAVVELAISRWARGARGGSSAGSTSSSSSSDTSSSFSSSSHSVNTLARLRRRLRARSSQASLQTIQSERDIVARITRLKALEESRQIPRLFTLYIPSTIEIPGQKLGTVLEGNDEFDRKQGLSTTSLSLVLNQLDVIAGKSRWRRPRGRARGSHLTDGSQPPSRRHQPPSRSLKVRSHSYSPFTAPKKSRKGKRKLVHGDCDPSRRIPIVTNDLMPKAWFLDVASPSWEDLRALGKVLHIHPLTLEDILQQDPREKLELFPKLGYYFVSFRAMEGEAERSKMQREARRHAEASGNDPDATSIPIGEANVYLAVFNDGICCFHYRDISEHVDRVRNRIVLLDEVVNMSSDWIAHGIVDSIVDSFFPLLNEIEKEVVAIDKLVYAEGGEAEDTKSTPIAEPPTPSTLKPELENEPVAEKHHIDQQLEKNPVNPNTNTSEESIRPHFTAPRPTLRMLFRRYRRNIASFFREWRRNKKPETRINPRASTLRRMARTRRLVTSLGRLLATKSDVIGQIRKRLLQQGVTASLGNGGSKGEELEVAIYMGDVQDHILTLQHSLNHIERMLSESHPSYLSQLRVTVARTKGGSDKSFVYLTVLTIAVLCCQTTIGLFSMNIHVPSNEHAPGAPHYVFGIVVSLVCCVLTTYLTIVRYWWQRAKRKRATMLRNDPYYTPAT